jgi:16S rRNA (adenine1518-N6/adenine1519-N6)-dimethyltransferase
VSASAPSLAARVKDALAAHGLKPLHRFGQNFLIDQAALDALLRAADAGPGTRIVEVGPGTGVLTAPLLDAGATVLAVEIDHGLARILRDTLVPRGLQLIEGDALASKTQLHPAIVAFAAAAGPWKLVANLPYDVALPVILDAVALPTPPTAVVVTIQREAAERLVAKPGDDAWGATSTVLQAAGIARIIRHLGPACFMPRPRVDSSILHWVPERPLPAGFGGWCRSLFAYRRKVLPGAMRDAFELPRDRAEAQCVAAGLDPLRRVEQLVPAELLRLHDAGAADS